MDDWQLRLRWYWPQSHDDVVQKLFGKARKGTRVIYVPGNHDGSMRRFAALAFGGIRVETETLHVTATGKRLLVVHGDLFDAAVRHRAWITLLGDGAYSAALRMGRWLNATRARLGIGYGSLARFMKGRAPDARELASFEEAAVAEARRLGADGVVCGHIHRPDMRMVGETLYCNDGDWVESLSALVETESGELQLIDWQGRPLRTIARVPRAAPRPAGAAGPFPVPPELSPSPAE